VQIFTGYLLYSIYNILHYLAHSASAIFTSVLTLDKLVQWTDKWQMQFNVSKCKVMLVGQKMPKFLYTMRSSGLQIVEVENDLGLMISSDLKRLQQLMYAR